jgi:hypothetical protein
MTTGSDILAADYVAIQDKAQALLGIGSGSRGYGQTVQSSDVTIGNIITKAQWDALRYDIVNIRYHQDGVLPNIVTVNRGDPIRYRSDAPNTNYNTLVETAITNRFQIATNQSILSPAGSVSTSASAKVRRFDRNHFYLVVQYITLLGTSQLYWSQNTFHNFLNTFLKKLITGTVYR